MTILLAVLGTLFFMAVAAILGFACVLALHLVAIHLGWYSKDLKMSFIDRKLMEILRR